MKDYLVIFVNGFRLGKYAGRIVGGKWERPTIQSRILTSDPNYWNLPNKGEIDTYYKIILNDFNAIYVNGSDIPRSTAEKRYNLGKEIAREMHNQGMNLKEDETIKFVSHSHGGAVSAGMMLELLELGYDIEVAYYLAPHQPEDFIHNEDIEGYQRSRKSDLVSSKGPLAKIVRSKLATIEGISEEEGHYEEFKNMLRGHGGHSVQTYLVELIQEYIDNGGEVYMIEMIPNDKKRKQKQEENGATED